MKVEEALEPQLKICDPHFHIMDSFGFNYPLKAYEHDLRNGHRVVSSVYVEAGDHYRTSGPEHLRPVGEVEFARTLLDDTRWSRPRLAQGIVGFVNLTQGSLVAEVLDAQIEAGRGALKGIRHDQAWSDDAQLWTRFRDSGPELYARQDFRTGVAELTRRGLLLETWQYYYQLPIVAKLAHDFPDTTIVVDHTGGIVGVGSFARRAEEIFATWRGHVRELARLPNVWMKLGGLGMEITGFDFHQRSDVVSSGEIAAAWGRYFETCIEAFGPARCLFESNFPIDSRSCSYTTLWNAFKRITSGASASEKALLFHDSAVGLYKLAGAA